jgi:hypothetical protein
MGFEDFLGGLLEWLEVEGHKDGIHVLRPHSQFLARIDEVNLMVSVRPKGL